MTAKRGTGGGETKQCCTKQHHSSSRCISPVFHEATGEHTVKTLRWSAVSESLVTFKMYISAQAAQCSTNKLLQLPVMREPLASV